MAPVLFIHCTLGHGGMWRGVTAGLPTVAPILIDLPGHGRGPEWDRAQDFHDQATALALAALPDHPCAIVGHSFGATIAMRLALEHPARVRALVLIEPVLFGLARSASPEVFAANEAAFQRCIAAAQAGDDDTAARLFTEDWGAGVSWEAMPAAARTSAAEKMAIVFATGSVVNDDAPGLLTPGRLEALRIPVLLLEGSDAPPVVAVIQSGLARRIPNAARTVIHGAGHMSPVTHPQAVARAISEWGGLAVQDVEELIDPGVRH